MSNRKILQVGAGLAIGLLSAPLVSTVTSSAADGEAADSVALVAKPPPKDPKDPKAPKGAVGVGVNLGPLGVEAGIGKDKAPAPKAPKGAVGVGVNLGPLDVSAGTASSSPEPSSTSRPR